MQRLSGARTLCKNVYVFSRGTLGARSLQRSDN